MRRLNEVTRLFRNYLFSDILQESTGDTTIKDLHTRLEIISAEKEKIYEASLSNESMEIIGEAIKNAKEEINFQLDNLTEFAQSFVEYCGVYGKAISLADILSDLQQGEESEFYIVMTEWETIGKLGYTFFETICSHVSEENLEDTQCLSALYHIQSNIIADFMDIYIPRNKQNN